MAQGHRLPPLQSLVYFESAARNFSFTGAARELGTTQPAVSQRITQLEQDLGTPLFERQHRGVALTPNGQQLLSIVAESLRNIGAEAEIIRLKSIRNHMHIATDMGFATYWLLPRLDALHRLLPGQEIQISTSPEEFRSREQPADIAILFGDGQWSGCQAEQLFPELVVPVCSPAYARTHGLPADSQAHARHRLLGLPDSVPQRWMDWKEWFTLQGAKEENQGKAIVFNAYSLLIQATLQGQGIALGWFPLVNDLLERGELLCTQVKRISTNRGYYLVRPHNALYSDAHDTIRDWILNEASALRRQKIANTEIC